MRWSFLCSISLKSQMDVVLLLKELHPGTNLQCLLKKKNVFYASLNKTFPSFLLTENFADIHEIAEMYDDY